MVAAKHTRRMNHCSLSIRQHHIVIVTLLQFSDVVEETGNEALAYLLSRKCSTGHRMMRIEENRAIKTLVKLETAIFSCQHHHNDGDDIKEKLQLIEYAHLFYIECRRILLC